MSVTLGEAERPWQVVVDEIAATVAAVDVRAFAMFREQTAHVEGRLFFGGQGRSGLVAQMSAMRAMHLGNDAHVVGEATAPSIRRGDCLILISASGATPTSLAYARIAHEQQAFVAAVTGHEHSPLAELADVELSIPLATTRQFGGSLFEQVSLVLLDALVLGWVGGDAAAHERMQYRHSNLQ